LAAYRPPRPDAKFVGVFENLHRHLVITLERLLRVGPERLHLALAVGSHGRIVDLEEQLALVNDPEKGLV
jgi:hypothetical protein